MSAQSFNFMAGEDVVVPIPISDADGAADLSGASARFVAARKQDGSLVADSDASTATVSIEDSTVTVSIPDTVTDGLRGTYRWELKLTDALGGERVSAYGYMTARGSLTAESA